MIVALTGLAGTGKSTAAAILSERHGFARTRFTGPLKAMLRAYFAALGLAPVIIEAMIEGELKELPSPYLCGRSPRYAMQHLGTAWGRDLMAPEFWVEAWQHAVVDALERGASGVVVEDCRFPNEAEAVRALGGRLIRVTRPGLAPIASDHPSEGQMLGEDGEILNDGDLDLLARRLDFAVRSLARAA